MYVPEVLKSELKKFIDRPANGEYDSALVRFKSVLMNSIDLFKQNTRDGLPVDFQDLIDAVSRFGVKIVTDYTERDTARKEMMGSSDVNYFSDSTKNINKTQLKKLVRLTEAESVVPRKDVGLSCVLKSKSIPDHFPKIAVSSETYYLAYPDTYMCANPDGTFIDFNIICPVEYHAKTITAGRSSEIYESETSEEYSEIPIKRVSTTRISKTPTVNSFNTPSNNTLVNSKVKVNTQVKSVISAKGLSWSEGVPASVVSQKLRQLQAQMYCMGAHKGLLISQIGKQVYYQFFERLADCDKEMIARQLKYMRSKNQELMLAIEPTNND